MADGADDDAGAQQPLRGVVLCTTSLAQDARTRVTEVSVAMGAVHRLDLTSDVTHLLVANVNTPKYRYVAKERPDIKVLHPDWLEEVRQGWIAGDDVDVRALEEKHKLGTFFGLQICVTGFEDMDQRNFISDTVVRHGANYHGDLTRFITHLICKVPTGAKYSHAIHWGVPVVSLKWFDDSTARGMALDASLYDPLMPVEEQGKGAFRSLLRPRTSLGKHPRGVQSLPPADEPGRRKLRRTASSRLSSQSQDMWQDMSADGFALQQSITDQWADSNEGQARPKSEVPEHGNTIQVDRSSLSITAVADTEQAAGLFEGWHICLHGFERDKADRLQQYLAAHGARLVRDASQLEDASTHLFFRGRCLLVPHAPIASQVLPAVPPGTAFATEWWVERCIQYKSSLDPESDVLSQPVWLKPTQADFKDLVICSTGFRGLDLRQAAAAIRIAGATYQETLVPSASLLISAATQIKLEKALYASKHKIPVVTADWLWESLKSGKKAPLDKFKVQVPVWEPTKLGREASSGSPPPTEMAVRRSSVPPKYQDENKSSRLSGTRRHHAAPPLSLRASAPHMWRVQKQPPLETTEQTAEQPKKQAQSGPFLEEDDHDAEAIPLNDSIEPTPANVIDSAAQCLSQPLQERSPNVSPRKSGLSQDTKDEKQRVNGDPPRLGLPEKSPEILVREGETNVQQQPLEAVIRQQDELAADLQSILARQVRSRSSGSATPSDPPGRRKPRQLGRATSGLSNRSMSASAQSQQPSPALNPAQDPKTDGASESFESSSFADGFMRARTEPVVPFGTQLGYETPEAEAHRRHVNRRMGTKLEADDAGGRRVQRIGVVKDAELSRDAAAQAGIGGRVRAKARNQLT